MIQHSVILIFIFLFAETCFSQRDIRIMFYNTENLFDTADDPKKNDNDFTPKGNYYWTEKRYNQKLQNIYKVITAVGEWTPPEIVGFCEVENKKVLTDLIQQTPLVRQPYKIVHFDSPDPRGIDVALIYKSDKLTLLQSKPIPVIFPPKLGSHKTRDILLSKFLFNRNDTFFVFVNHWPSRRGGEKESDNFRMFAAKALKYQTDSIFKTNKNAKIIIVGDFNDEPSDESLIIGLKAITTLNSIQSGKLYNLATNFIKDYKTGTHKFQGQWSVLDQIIVSGSLLSNSKKIYTKPLNAKVLNSSFLLYPDKRNFGYLPSRTYSGMKYTGGFSDHLPVYIDLLIKK